MKILIIDDSKDFRELVRYYLSKVDGIELTEHAAEELGLPGDDFVWSDYDVLLLDYNLGGKEDGFDCLKKFSDREDFPPTIILTAEGDEYIAIKAIKLGAADYLNKVDITPNRLFRLIKEAVKETPQVVSTRATALSSAEQRVSRLSSKEISYSSYKLIRKIGQGAMSEVYLAERKSDGLSLVLKLLDLKSPPKDATIERFMQEAQLVSGLDSPLVVKIFEHGITDKYAFIAMEFLARGDLMQRMELNISIDLALTYMEHILHGLKEIHKVGVMHRDLKPANIMFRGDDSMALTDFGISKKIDTPMVGLTTEGRVIGTPVYMSPEQGRGLAVDIRTDIYSAGVIFYELLTRRKPFFSFEPLALIYKHIYEEVPRLPEEIGRFQGIIDKMMEKKATDRYQSAVEAIKALRILRRNERRAQ